MHVAVRRDLLAGEHGVERQQAEAVDAPRPPTLDAAGVVDRAAEDLAAAADPEDPGRRRGDGPVEARARIHARSAATCLEPGSTTRSAPSRSAGCSANVMRAAWASRCSSSRFEPYGKRSTATRWAPGPGSARTVAPSSSGSSWCSIGTTPAHAMPGQLGQPLGARRQQRRVAAEPVEDEPGQALTGRVRARATTCRTGGRTPRRDRCRRRAARPRRRGRASGC